MASIINASTSAGLVQTADTSGVLQLQTNSGTTALTLGTDQKATFAGTVQTDTLKASSGVLATQNGMTGIAKAWVNFNSISGTSAVIRGSFNVSSVTYRGTGQYTINFATSMTDVNYSLAGMIGDESAAAGMMYLTGTTGSATTSSVQVNTVNTGGVLVNRTTNTCIILGN